jgi:hypothetical protein
MTTAAGSVTAAGPGGLPGIPKPKIVGMPANDGLAGRRDVDGA